MVVYRDHNRIKIYLVFAQANDEVIHALDTFCRDQQLQVMDRIREHPFENILRLKNSKKIKPL